MSLWNKLINYITDRQNRRRIVLWFLAFILLISVVLFGKDIQDFFKSLRGRAAGPSGTELEWELLDKDLPESVAHTGLIEVNHNGYRYIYKIGGVHRNEDGEGTYLSRKVERLQLDNDGYPAANSDWETNDHWGEMFSGHAEFGIFQSGDYLYVVSGDIHLPVVDDPDEEVPLVFSTIERLNLNKIANNSPDENYWEVIAKVAGINFYPEIKISNNELHIIGGLYGLPKTTAESWGGGTPAVEPDWRWEAIYKDLPTVGSDKLIILPKAGLGANIEEGGFITDGYKEELGIDGGIFMGLSGVSGNSGSAGYPDYENLPDEYKEDIENVSGLLSKLLISGDFATTVSEHYIVDINSMATDNLIIELESELGIDQDSYSDIETAGNDYEGTLFNTWEIGKVSHIEHLRIVLDTTFAKNPEWDVGGWNVLSIYPALQGRYGHEVFEQDGKIYTLGGASWTSTIERSWIPTGSIEESSAEINTFWVIDDKGHPVNKLFIPSTLQNLDYEYEYLGNALYGLYEGATATYWQGTNQESNANPLSSDFVMPRDGQGQAFFGFSEYNYSSADGEAGDHLILGGLANNNTSNGYEDEPALRIFVSQDGEETEPYYEEPSEGVWPDTPPANWPNHWPWPPTEEGPEDGYPEEELNSWPTDWPWPPDSDTNFEWLDEEVFRQNEGYLAAIWLDVLEWPWPPQSESNLPSGWPSYDDPGDIDPLEWGWYDTWPWPPTEDGPVGSWPSSPPPNWVDDYPDADWPPTYGENEFPSGGAPVYWPDSWPWDKLVIPPAVTADYAFGVSVKVVDWSTVFKDDNSGWVIQPSLNYEVYGIHSFKVGDAVISFGGKQAFQPLPDFPFEDKHIPDYEHEEIYQTFMYKNGNIYLMSNVKEPSSEYATLAVKTPIPDTPAGDYTYIYKAGGTLDKLSHTTKTVELLGRFDMGMTGVIDPSKSTIEIVPLRNDYEGEAAVVRADHFDYATVTITLRDYYGDEITSSDNIPEGIGATLFTDRSIIPAVDRDINSQIVKDKYNETPVGYKLGFGPRLDHIQMLGNAFPAENLNPNWKEYWLDQVAVIDRGNNEDGNEATDIGQVQFRISTRSGHDSNPLNELADAISVRANLVDINQDDVIWGREINDGAPIIFSRHGYPNPAQSKIYADNVQLTIENNYNADVNVEARDFYEAKVNDIRVILKSARNEGISDPADYPDKIDPAGLIDIDDDGNMLFDVKSGAHGVMQLRVYYEAYIPGRTNIYTGELEEKKVCGYITLVLDTKGKIISILPDYGYQGEDILEVNLIGELTSWRDDIVDSIEDKDENTELEFIPPNDMEFYWYNDSGLRISTDDLLMSADGLTNYKLSVDANPGDEIELTIIEDETIFTIVDGTFLPHEYGQPLIKQMTIYAGEDKDRADFSYRVGINAGILKINVENKTAQVTSELWVSVLGNYSNLELRLSANPTSIIPYNEGTNILASPHINGYPVSDPGAIISNYNYYMDDVDATLEDPNEFNGIFDINYRRTDPAAPGKSHIFITAEYGSGAELMVGTITINKPLADDVVDVDKIIFDSFDVDDSATTDISINNVTIGSSANLGLWTVITSTLIYDETTDTSNLYKESVLFRVVDESFNPDNKYLKRITPNHAERNKTHRLEIEGNNTNFVATGDYKSIVTFTHVDEPSITKGGILEAEVLSVDPANTTELLVVSLKLDHDAQLGFYNLRVYTPIGDSDPEDLELAGERDLWVTTSDNGYFVDMIANPDEVVRDGESTSNVIASVGYADYASGEIEYLPGEEVEFDWYQEVDEGTLHPDSNTTDNDGEAITIYTVDFGLENDQAQIEGACEITEYGGLVKNYVVIKKLGYEDHNQDVDASQTTISAVPKYVPADGDAFSVVTVTVRNMYFSPLEDVLVDLSTNRPSDVIRLSDGSSGSSTETDIDGKAIFQVSSEIVGTSTVTAAVDDFEISEDIYFETEGSLIPRLVDITVPFESRDYDNLTLVYIAEVQDSGDSLEFVNEVYTKTPRPDNELIELNQILLYFHPGKTYNIWAKGRYNLGRLKQFFPGSGIEPEIIVIDMADSNGKGLFIGDLLPNNFDDGYGNITLSPFHDNAVNTLDFGLLFNDFFDVVGEGIGNLDWNKNEIINVLDLGYMFKNYGNGKAGGPPPYDKW